MIGAGDRALHPRLKDDPKILAGQVAPRLIDPDGDRQSIAPALDHPFAKQWRAGFRVTDLRSDAASS
jgi:hypothetical protein